MTTSHIDAPELTWHAPGKGTWNLVSDHYSRPITAAIAPFTEVWSEASSQYMTELGMPIRSARMATVNGLSYVCIDAGAGGSKAPPPWLMRMLVKVIPELRRGEKRLREVLNDRPWREGVRQWYERDRVAAIARMRRLSATDPTSLENDALADHLESVLDEAMRSGREHILLHGHDTFPPGLFVLAATRWGISRRDAFGLLAGASPASAGTSPELLRLREVVGSRIVVGLDEIRALGSDAADALDEFVLVHGWRVVDGYDIDSVCLAEVPDLVVRRVIAPLRPAVDASSARAVARDSVPVADRPEFDRLLDEGRAAYGLRDDNGGILIAWPIGLLRRAMLAAGRRLCDGDDSLAVEATVDEVVTALRGLAGLHLDELRRRRDWRRSIRASDAPAVLGPPEPPMPKGLGGALGTLFDVFDVYDFGAPPGDRADLCGEGIGVEPYTGRARLVVGADAAAIASFEPGDVLVAPLTSPSYNVILAVAGALVTEAGGAMSHAAIMARELALPAVLGAPNAVSRICDGDLVTVDPRRGTVTVAR